MRKRLWWKKCIVGIVMTAVILGSFRLPAPALAALPVPSGSSALINDDFNGASTAQLTSTDTSSGGLSYTAAVSDPTNVWIGIANNANGTPLSSDALIINDASGKSSNGTVYGSGSGSGTITKSLGTTVSAGLLTIEEDLYFFGLNNDISRGRTPLYLYGGVNSTTNKSDILIEVDLKNAKIQWKDNAGTFYPITPVNVAGNVWYHLKAVVNIDTFKVDYFMSKGSDGSSVGSLLQQPFYNKALGALSTDFAVAKSFSASVGGSTAESMALDNIQVYKPNAAPDKPTGLNAVAGNTQVALYWPAAKNAGSYELLRSSQSADYVSIVSGLSVPPTADSPYIDMNLTNDTTYYYKVRAMNLFGSADSDPVSVVPSGVTPLPAPPSGISADIRDSAVQLTWNVNPDASTYTLKRSTSPGGTNTVLSSSLPATQTSYYDTALSDGTTYYYTLTSKNIAGIGSESDPVAATPSAPFASPANVKATASNNQVTLSWDSVPNAGSYHVKRSTVSGGPYTLVAGNVTGLSYTDTSVTNGTTYYYAISAVSANVESMNTLEVAAAPYNAPGGAPAAPSSLTVTSDDSRVTVEWDAVSGADSYRVKRAAAIAGSYTTIANVSGAASYQDTGVMNGMTYFYEVSALNASGEGAASSTAIATPAHVVVVSQDGTGDFTTIQAAVNSIPTNNTTRQVIYIRDGYYYEKLVVDRPYISFVGESRDGTILAYDDYSCKPDPNGTPSSPSFSCTNAGVPIGDPILGTGNSYSVKVTAGNFSAENVTILNTAFPRTVVAPAVALYVTGDKAVFTNVRLSGYQDTVYVNSGRQYYKNVIIEGDADWIFGNATVVFDSSEIKFDGNKGGYVTAASTDQGAAYGYVFLNSKLTRGTSFLKNYVTKNSWNPNGWDPAWDIDNNISATDGTVNLGRPWRPYANVKYINTWMDAHIKAVGWDNWGNTANESTASYGEYNSTGPGANPQGRFAWTKQLTANEANQYTVQNILQGTDGWNPTLFGGLPQHPPVQSGPSITPGAAAFDKNPANQAGIAVTVQTGGGGTKLISITNGSYTLDPTTDYTINGNVYTINKSYLVQLPVGTAALQFQLSSGISLPLTIAISNSTPLPSQTIASVPPLTLYSIAGVAPYLPTVIPVNYTDQTTAAVSVTWNSVDPSQYAAPGSFIVQGTAAGTTIPAVATVNVQSPDSVGTVTGGSDLQSYLTNLPFQMPALAEPQFPAGDFNVQDYGAVGDGKTKNTAAFANAIAAAASAGGGRVVVPAGVWLTGPIELKSNVNLHVEKGSEILFSTDYSDYGDGSQRYKSLLSGTGVSNIAITGDGIINGNGQAWRYVKKSKMSASQWNYLLSSGGVVSPDGSMWYPNQQQMANDNRPLLLDVNKSRNVLIDGPTLVNSPQFSTSVHSSQNIIIRNTTVNNDWWAQNGDGLDVTSSQNVVLYHNTVNAGDDAIGMKSSGSPSDTNVLANVVIADNIVFRGHGGFVVGSNTSGGIQNIAVRNNQYIGTDVGIKIKSYVGGGGIVQNIYMDGIHMQNIADDAINFDAFYKGHDTASDNAQPGDYRVPEFKNIHISNVTADGAAQAVFIDALPHIPMHDVDLNHVTIKAGQGWISNHATNFQLNNVQIIPSAGTVYTLNDSTNFLFNHVLSPKGTATFIHLAGNSSGIQLIDTDYSTAKVPFQWDPGISHDVITVTGPGSLTTTAALSPAQPNGQNGWYVNPVTVTLSATDQYSGVAGTVYSLDGGSSWQPYAGPFIINNEGTSTITFRSTDNAGIVEKPKTVTVNIDQTAPALNVVLDQTSIWPANHNLVTVHAAVYGNDAISQIDSIVLTSITSSESDNGLGDGDQADDIQGAVYGTLDTSFMLRAERSAHGTGRIYTVTYTITDKAGNKTAVSATVTVPHDQSGM